MVKLGDLLQKSVKQSSGLDAEWLMKFASVIKLDLDEAASVYEKHGNGMIYAKGGFALPDSPRTKRIMINHFGRVVLVDSLGNAIVLDKRDLREMNEISNKARKNKQECRERKYKQEIAEYRERRKTERMFKSCQENPNPKRAGKANGQGDIGRYVNFRGVRMEMTERKCKTRLATIVINI